MFIFQNSLKMSKKNTCLSLDDKYQLCKMSENGSSVKHLQNLFNCGKTQVYNALKNKNKIKEDWIKGKDIFVFILFVIIFCLLLLI